MIDLNAINRALRFLKENDVADNARAEIRILLETIYAQKDAERLLRRDLERAQTNLKNAERYIDALTQMNSGENSDPVPT